MKIILLILVIFCKFGDIYYRNIDLDWRDREYIQELIRPFKVKHKGKIVESILYYSYKYNIEPKMFARLVKTESGFDRMAKSSKGAIGLTQVIPEYWEQEIFYCVERQVGKRLFLRTKVDYTKYLYIVDISIEVGVRILRKHLNTYGDLEIALCAYNLGRNHTYFKKLCLDPKKRRRYNCVDKVVYSL